MQFETTKRFILASQSPRRRELLGQLGIEFDVQSADVEETSVPFETAAQYVRDVALLKTRAIDAPDAVVIGSDTIVVKDGQLLHKPKNHAEAVAHLKALSGATHEVMTAVAIIEGHKEVTFVETVRVTFYPLSDEFIEAYVQTGDPFDKAGGYGIQTDGVFFVEKIEGDYLSVVGLPLARLTRTLLDEKWIALQQESQRLSRSIA